MPEQMDGYIADGRRCRRNTPPSTSAPYSNLPQRLGVKLASHDDATEAHVEEAIADGVSIAEFPTTREAAQAAHRNGLAVLMGAPNVVRGNSHSGNISAAEVAAIGHLDVLSSDYVPSSLLSRRLQAGAHRARHEPAQGDAADHAQSGACRGAG